MVRRSQLVVSARPQQPVLMPTKDVQSSESRVRAQAIFFLLCALFIAVALTGLSTPAVRAQDLSQTPPTPPPFDPSAIPTPQEMPLAIFGKSSYSENCAPCHGDTGNSDGPVVANLPAPPPKFSDPATRADQSPAEYFHIVKYGRMQNMMPPWGNRLSDEEIWQVVYYAWSLHTSEAKVQQGRTLYDAQCVACHGEQGKGDGPQASVDLTDFSNNAAMMLLSDSDLDAGWRKAHPELGTDWSPAERQSVLDAIRAFSFSEPWNVNLPPGDGVLTGAVSQGTAGGDVITTTEVGLTGYINFDPVITTTTTADAQGQFTFTQLSLASGLQYVVDTTYKGLNYTAFAPTMSPITPTADVNLMVYETTDSGSTLHMQRLSLVVDFEPGSLLLGVISDLFNVGDRTYTGSPVAGLDKPATLVVPLLPGATDINFQDGELGGRYTQIGDTVYDVAAIPPGERVNFVSYRLPISQTVQTIQPQFAYPVGQVNVLVADLPGLKVDIPGLSKSSVEQIQGRDYQIWVGDMPASGLQVTVDGALLADSVDPRAAMDSSAGPVSSFAVANISAPIAWSLAGVLAILLAAVLIYPMRGGPKEPQEALKLEREELLQRIAALDDLHAVDQIETAVWQQQRAQLKSRLLDVAQAMGDTQQKVP